MEPELQSSFIPKRALERPEPNRRQPLNLLLVIALVIAFISAALWGGAFFYRGLLTKQVEGLRASVEKERQNLDQATIQLFQRVDRKLKVAKELLVAHAELVPVFRMLEELTLPSVQYTNFSFGNRAINLDGRASSYEDIALQTQEFARDQRRIESFIFSDLNLSESGQVTFKLTIVPEPGLTVYSPTASR